MFLITLITTIINFLASNPTATLMDNVFVWFDKGVYRLVSSSFTLFMIMCQLNLNVIYSLAASLIDRLKALIIVFIIFKVGVSLIQYMLKPDEALNKSKKLLLNILICAVLLVSYNVVFSALNEVSMMIVGKPASYHYTTLKQIAGATDAADEGLIMRLFFGKNSNTTEITTTESIGDNIAVNTLCATFSDIQTQGLTCANLKQVLNKGGKVDYSRLDNILSKMGKTVNGHPVIALLVGLYIVYSVIKAAIEIGVRMFKLMLLQLVAPIAIVSVASEEGTKADPFKSFIKMYVSVFISAFSRIVAILLVTVFVSKIFSQLSTLIGDVQSQSASDYSLWILIICIVAGYRFAGEIPKMIDEIFKTKMGSDPDKGFGKFMLGLAAAPVMGVAGLAAGFASGDTALSKIYGAGAGALSGITAGLTGQTIADKVKNYRASQDKIGGIQAGMDAGGGNLLTYIDGKWFEGKKYQDRQIKAYDDEIAVVDAASKERKALNDAVTQKMKSDKGKAFKGTGSTPDEVAASSAKAANAAGFTAAAANIEFGDSRDSYASQMIEEYEPYKFAQDAIKYFTDNPDAGPITYEGESGSFSYSDISEARSKSATSKKLGEDAAKEKWDEEWDRQLTSAEEGTSIHMHRENFKQAATKVYGKGDTEHQKEINSYGDYKTTDGQLFVEKDLRSTAKDNYMSRPQVKVNQVNSKK